MKKELALMNAVGLFNHVAANRPNQHMQLTNSEIMLSLVIYCDDDEKLAYRIKKELEEMVLKPSTIEVTYIPWHKRTNSPKDLYYLTIEFEFEK